MNQMVPLQLQLASEYKERQARYAAAVFKAPPLIKHVSPETPPPPLGKPSPTKLEQEAKCLRLEIQIECLRAELQKLKMDSDQIEAVVRQHPISHIISVTAEYFGIPSIDIRSNRRNTAVVIPRQIAMYLAKTMTIYSLPEIGRRFSNRDHTTVLYSVRKIERLIKTDADLRAKVEALRAQLAPNGGE